MLNQTPKNQFYPSTEELAHAVRRRITQVINEKTRILDPSAGDGVLLKPFARPVNTHDRRQINPNRNLFAIEIDQDLRYVLSGKGYSVIGTDFLEFHEPQKFDVIAMNPPFNDGDSHVLHAWDLLAPEGELVAILNQETIDNPYSRERKLLASLIESNGTTERLGQAFRSADRKTSVEVALIRLVKPKAGPESFEGFNRGAYEQDPVRDEEFAADPLARTDFIRSLCDRYKGTEAALIERHKAQQRLMFFLDGVGANASFHQDNSELKGRDALYIEAPLEAQLAAVKLKFWDELFSKSQLTQKATTDFRAKFMEFARSQSHMAFNYANCMEVLISVLGNRENIFRDAIDNLFRIGCSFDKGNTTHWEGWKSNDSWKWNKKLIIPYAFSWNSRSGFEMSYGTYGSRATDFLGDLDKVLSTISGEEIEIASDSAYQKHIRGLCFPGSGYNVAYSSWIETTFIRFRVYKKGTIHIEFLDSSLLDEFNRQAAKDKPWMPPKSSYKQPKYRQRRIAA
jgi:hypothetical protein